jgi:hypothetical protein
MGELHRRSRVAPRKPEVDDVNQRRLELLEQLRATGADVYTKVVRGHVVACVGPGIGESGQSLEVADADAATVDVAIADNLEGLANVYRLTDCERRALNLGGGKA